MENKLTLGSLFDGSGGFPLGGFLNGITPVWASEIEPFPIRVTSKRIPAMKHHGNICDINGADIEPVDIITFGSPCTDMSVAGRRAGLDGKQSVLFYEAIRITKEMRCKTNGAYPRFIVWENVPGAFSSNKGEDFRAVLEAVIGIAQPETEVPAPEKGRWPYADCYVGDGWSVAYRTVDAQYFGVPQRRRRIYLVADFGSERAAEILFERESLPRDFKAGIDPRQGASPDAPSSPGASGIVLNDQGGSSIGCSRDTTATLRAESHGHPPCVLQSSGFCTEHSAKSRGVGYEEEKSPTIRSGVVPGTVISFEPGASSRVGGHCLEGRCGTLRAAMGDNQMAVAIENHPTDSRVRIDESGTVQTLTSRMGTGGMNVPLVMGERLQGLPVTENLAQTLMGTDYKGVQCVCEPTPKTLKIRSGCEGGGKGALVQEDMSATLGCNNDQTLFVPTVFGICSDKSNAMLSENPNSGIYLAETSRTIDKNGGNPSCNQGGMAVVSLQGSIIGRDDSNGPQGDGINEEVSFTLNTIDRHAVAYGLDRASFNQGKNAQYNFSVEEEQAQTIVAKGPGAVARPASFYPQMKAESQCYREDGTSNTLINGTNPGYQNGVVETEYAVRRLTPTECARLQGFPDDWCHGLESISPSEDEISKWEEIFETYRKAIGKSAKPKSRSQVAKWLKAPYSDAAEYKIWGNGVALPCVCYVLAGIRQLVKNQN